MRSLCFGNLCTFYYLRLILEAKMTCFMNLKTLIKGSSVTSSDLEVNVLLLVCIVVKLELFKCVAHIAGKETKEIMCKEDPPLLLGVVLYILMFTPAEDATVGKRIYKRSDKCVKTITAFEHIPLPAFHDAFFF